MEVEEVQKGGHRAPAPPLERLSLCPCKIPRTATHAPPLQTECDTDVTKQCPAGTARRPGGMFTIGVAGRCLSKALVQGAPLAPKCRQLVLVAAPKDARVYLQVRPSAARPHGSLSVQGGWGAGWGAG